MTSNHEIKVEALDLSEPTLRLWVGGLVAEVQDDGETDLGRGDALRVVALLAALDASRAEVAALRREVATARVVADVSGEELCVYLFGHGNARHVSFALGRDESACLAIGDRVVQLDARTDVPALAREINAWLGGEAQGAP